LRTNVDIGYGIGIGIELGCVFGIDRSIRQLVDSSGRAFWTKAVLMVNKPSVQASSFGSQKKRRKSRTSSKETGSGDPISNEPKKRTVDPIQTAGEVEVIEAESIEVFEGGGSSWIQGTWGVING
jgi:hypothetical protein